MATRVRPSIPEDAAPLCAVQTRIIEIGGTTAREYPYTLAEFANRYLTGPAVLCCHTAEILTAEGSWHPIGLQCLVSAPDLPEGWASIGTFVDPEVQRSGAGQALFAATQAAARAKGIRSLNATIRSDNAPGLGYYARLGFRDYAAGPDHLTRDGSRIPRIRRQFEL